MRSVTLPSFVDSQQAVWTRHICDLLNRLKIPEGEQVGHLVVSISTYCKEFHPAGVRTRDLHLLLARAFCSIGEPAFARIVLESIQPHARHVERWIEILSELHHFPQLLPYFSQGIVRPADWAGAKLDRMWTVDFSRLALADSDRHEMLLCKTLRIMLERIAIFWDSTQGEGTVGLKGLAYIESTSDYLLTYSEDILTRQKKIRNWTQCPKILNVDG